MKKSFFIILLYHFSINAEVLKNNNTIIITASTGELGEITCETLAKEGYNLIITGRNQKKLDNLQKKLKYTKVNIQNIVIDFSDIKTIENAVQKISSYSIKGIVLIGSRPTLSKDSIPKKEEWLKNFSETFIAPLEVLRLFEPYIQDNGSIIIMSGATSKYYMPAYPNTNVIRLAWSGEIKNLSQHFSKHKIRVNAISPGIILTKHHEEKIKENAILNNLSFNEQLVKATDSMPLKSYGKPEDVANLISFLLSDKASHINSTNILLDGGESSAY